MKSGDYVAFRFTNYLEVTQGEVLFAKKIGCSPGELLIIKDESIYCNNIDLKLKKPQVSTYEKFDLFSYSGIIPSGKYFMIGESEYSFDSRYFGFIDISVINFKLKVLL